MEKKNPTKMDTSETEKGNATKKKRKGSKKARGKGKRKTLKTLEQKHPPRGPTEILEALRRNNKNPSNGKRGDLKSLERKNPRKGTESKRTPSSLKRHTEGVNGLTNPCSGKAPAEELEPQTISQ